tara:strand:- start:1003 stop:2145 length:1143 start_codon:yes stop_codon:yes gene_type:complete
MKKYLDFKYSKFITNENFNFNRKKILKVLPEKYLLDAHKVISNWMGYKKTPLINLNILSKKLQTKNIFYKDESKRFNLKSFKALGGAYAVEKISKNKKKMTVSTATAGNHGKSVSWGAKKIGAKCKIFISENVSDSRALEMEKLGAEVIKVKGNYEKSLRVCKEMSNKKGWQIVQDVAWRKYEYIPKLTMAGYSVMIKEISNQTKHYITHVFLQAGVGGMAAGMISGIAKYFRRIPKIIVIEPEHANCVMQSIKNRSIKKINIKKQSIMGGMSCAEVSLVPWRILKNAVNNCVSVSDKYVPQTLVMLAKKKFSEKKIIAGECSTPGIISLISCCNNAHLKKKLEINENSNILIIGCEGDTDKILYNKLYKIGKRKLKKYE